MTILHVTEPFASGITSFLEHLTNNLPQHHHIILHGGRTSGDREQEVKARFPLNTTFIKWKHAHREINPWHDTRAFFFLLKTLRKLSFDIVHLHSSKAGFLGRVACSWKNIRPVIYTPHAAAFLRKDISARIRKFYILLERIGYTLNGLIVSCCLQEQKEYAALSMKTRCVNNGTPITPITKNHSDHFIICTSGLLTAQKNPALFNTIAKHFQANPGIRFVWMGDGELRHELVSDNIELTGWINRSRIDEYLGKAQLYLSTSAWEGLPYAVLEAMNAECCLLLFRTGGHLNLVNENGELFINQDEAIAFIEKCFEFPEHAITLGKKSKQLCAAHFSAIEMGRNYDAIYHESALLAH